MRTVERLRAQRDELRHAIALLDVPKKPQPYPVVWNDRVWVVTGAFWSHLFLTNSDGDEAMVDEMDVSYE